MDIRVDASDKFIVEAIRVTITKEVNKMLGENFKQMSTSLLTTNLNQRINKYIDKCEKDGHFYHVLANNIADKIDIDKILEKFNEQEIKEMIADKLVERMIKKMK